MWNDADLEVRDELSMSKALSNSYAMAAAFAPLDALPDMLAGRPSFRTAEAIDPSTFKMIGFARVISDGAFAALLTDVVVHPNFRRNGIGRKIVRLLMKKCIKEGASSCVVFAPRERMFFWKCGFRWSNRYKVMSMPEE